MPNNNNQTHLAGLGDSWSLSTQPSSTVGSGTITLRTGNSTTTGQSSGSFAFFGGAGDLAGGGVGVIAGSGINGPGGSILYRAGAAGPTGGNGGAINFRGGPSTAALGGDIRLQPGAGTAGNGRIIVANATNVLGGEISFPEAATSGSNFVTLKGPDTLVADITFVLPDADGTTGQVLTTDGAGVMSWTTASGSAGNIYTTNGTVTGPREVVFGDNSLEFFGDNGTFGINIDNGTNEADIVVTPGAFNITTDNASYAMTSSNATTTVAGVAQVAVSSVNITGAGAPGASLVRTDGTETVYAGVFDQSSNTVELGHVDSGTNEANTISITPTRVLMRNTDGGTGAISQIQMLTTGSIPQINMSLADNPVMTLTSTASGRGVTLLENGSTVAGETHELRFRELSSNGAEYVGFKAPDAIGTSASTVWTLPATDGEAGQALVTDGSGILSFGGSVDQLTTGTLGAGPAGNATIPTTLGTQSLVDVSVKMDRGTGTPFEESQTGSTDAWTYNIDFGTGGVVFGRTGAFTSAVNYRILATYL